MKKKQPVVGVMPLWDDDKASYWMLPGYLNGLRAAQMTPVTLPPAAEADELLGILPFFDGFLFTGGHDINPALYGEKKLPACAELNADRDALETVVYRYAYDNDVPVLGICRGVQFINVMQGGTLYQDLPTQFDTKIDHHMAQPYDGVSHSVVILGDTPLHDLLNTEDLAVNSIHHQAVRHLGRGLNVMAVAEDGLIEGIYVPDKRFIWGVQWHPEYNFDSDAASLKIFLAFGEACGAYLTKTTS